MKIDENYTIESDKYCWVLKYRKEGEINPDTGKNSISLDESYHPTIKSCLRKYMDAKLKGSEGITEMINRINEVEQTINQINN